MSKQKYNIAVYCGAKNDIPYNMKKQAFTLGKQLADNNFGLVFGAGDCGLMGMVARGARDNGGYVIAVIPKTLIDLEPPIEDINETHIVDTMHIRKQMMFDNADAFIVLPGGLGTLDELFEILTWRSINIHTKPVVIINIDGYYDYIISHIYNMIKVGFSNSIINDYFYVADTTEDAISYINNEIK